MIKKIFPSLSSLGSDGNTAFLRAARAGHLDKVLEHLKNNVDINTCNTNGLNALHLASKDGHIDVVTELLKRGANVDSATKKGNTALHIASLAGQEDVVKLLVEHNASVNVQSQNGFTPLYMAAQENHDNVVKFLLSNNANQSLATEDGFTPLAVAMQQGHDKVVAVLLENDSRGKVRLPALHIAAKKDDCKAAALLLQNEHNPDVTSKSGFTPLHIASHYGNEGIAQLLLSKSADVNYSAKHNITPLHVAAKWGKANMVALLLDRGANIEAKTRDGLTPLHCAARSGHEQVVDMLLERGAPISSKTKNGLAPLHMASQGDHVDAARILLYHRAPVDDVTVDYLTALHVAAHCGHAAVARLLLDRKADPNARALNGFTPLHIACKKNRIKVVELLLKHGASIEATTESGLTPLHVASFMGCMNIVIYLVQNEASPDVTTVRGETPLHLAARANQTDIIRILLRNGAHVSARAREQQTPLHIASRLGNVDIVMLLLQHGAHVDCTTKDLYTPLHIAAKEGQEEVASVLVENGASLEAQTKKGFTPLHLAAKYGNMKVAKLLLQRDAPVDAQGKNGVTALHVASHYDHQNVALLLLEKGASPHATAKNGHTPLHIAARKNQMDIATTLLEYGAKAETESKAGFTPLHLSSQEGHTDMTTLLLDHHADPNHKAKNGLTPLHLCAQEDRVEVGSILIKNKAEIDATTKAGYTPLHVACHFGQANMVKLLLSEGASVKTTTAVNYTPLHQAAQQGHAGIVTTLLQSGADPNLTTNQGQTALSISQKLGYISVVESLKGVTETPTAPTLSNEDKYKVMAPETMQETFMSDSEDEAGEDMAGMSEQPYHYLTVDEMKTLGDDSLPIDVRTDTEHLPDNRDISGPPTAIDEQASPQHIKESYSQYAAMDNIEISKHQQHIGFLVSFLVDARGGAMRGCRHSGVRVIVPPRRAPAPLRITCRYLKRDKMPHPPPLMEGEALASRILELAPVAAKFLGPIMIEVPHFASLRNKEREIVVLRSDNGETWREHTFEATEEAVQDILTHSFDKEELSQLDENPRMSRILLSELPHYLAVVSRVKQEVHAIGPEGGMVSSTVVPQVQAVFPSGALTKKIKVGLQAQPIPMELTAKLLGNRVAVSPIVTVEPRRRKFHKPITLTIPCPQASSKGMINTYTSDSPTLRLLCSITGGTTRAQWEDVTGSTPLTFVNDCVSFTTTVSARFWLMDCRNIGDATRMATELYREAIHVPFMAKFVVFAKRTDISEARLRVFCMTDDKEDKTLEHQEHFTEVAKSRDVEVLEGKMQYVEFAGNLIPITKSGDQLQLGFRAFKENRLPFTVKVKDPHADAIGRIIFMKEPKVSKGDAPQQPICILNIVLPDNIIPEPLTPEHEPSRTSIVEGVPSWQRLTDISDSLGEDWIRLAGQLDVSMSQVNRIKTEYCDSSPCRQGLLMLKQWVQDAGNKASGSTLEEALRNIGRYDVVDRCLYNEHQISSYHHNTNQIEIINQQSPYYSTQPIKDINRVQSTVTKKQETIEKDDKEEKKYSAEEKEVDESEIKKSVSERKRDIERRISEEHSDKKVPNVTLRRSESREKSKEKDEKDKLEKEIFDEKSISPEPSNLSFDEKRLSFELGALIKEKQLPKSESIIQQKFLDSEKLVYQMTATEPGSDLKTQEKQVSIVKSLPEEERELSFQEKRLSFEKGLKTSEDKPEIIESKSIKKLQKSETVTSKEDEKQLDSSIKEIKASEIIIKDVNQFKQHEQQNIPQQKTIHQDVQEVKEKQTLQQVKEFVPEKQSVPTTLPSIPSLVPTPADISKPKDNLSEETGGKLTTSETEGKVRSPVQKIPDDPFEFIQENSTFIEDSFVNPQVFPQGINIPTDQIIDLTGKPVDSFSSGSPSIFRSPHRAADYVVFDDEDWDTQDVVEFSDVTNKVLPGSCPYVPEKFNEDSSTGELHQEKITVFEEPGKITTVTESVTIKPGGLQESLFAAFTPPNFDSFIQPPVTGSKTNQSKTSFQISDFPDITFPKEETEKSFQKFPEQFFDYNDLSSSGSNVSTIDKIKIDSTKNKPVFNVDDSMKYIIDFSETSKPVNQTKIDETNENLVEIVDVSEEFIPPTKQNQIKSDLIKKLDECLTSADEFKPRPKFGKKKQEQNRDSNIDISDQEISFNIPSVSSHNSEIQQILSNENISKLEDELDLLEKLEDQIKLLKEEEIKMKGIQEELLQNNDKQELEDLDAEELSQGMPDISRMEMNVKESIISEPSAIFNKEITELEPPLEISPEQIIANEDIVKAIEEAQFILSQDQIGEQMSGSASHKDEPYEEENKKKKKNRKRRGKKQKDDDMEHEQITQANISPGKSLNSPGTEDVNSEKEFQRMVSQLSVEEVDEALQIWNQDQIKSNQKEREEEVSSSSSQQK